LNCSAVRIASLQAEKLAKEMENAMRRARRLRSPGTLIPWQSILHAR
jgi:hypothetical protein